MKSEQNVLFSDSVSRQRYDWPTYNSIPPDYLYLTKVHFPREYSNVASVLIFISTVTKQLRDCNWYKGENNSNKDSC